MTSPRLVLVGLQLQDHVGFWLPIVKQTLTYCSTAERHQECWALNRVTYKPVLKVLSFSLRSEVEGEAIAFSSCLVGRSREDGVNFPQWIHTGVSGDNRHKLKPGNLWLKVVFHCQEWSSTRRRTPKVCGMSGIGDGGNSAEQGPKQSALPALLSAGPRTGWPLEVLSNLHNTVILF